MNISHSLTSDANLLKNIDDKCNINVKFHKFCLNKLTRLRNRKRKRPYEKVEESECPTRNASGESSRTSYGVDSPVCLFCGIGDLYDVLHNVSSTGIDLKLKTWPLIWTILKCLESLQMVICFHMTQFIIK